MWISQSLLFVLYTIKSNNFENILAACYTRPSLQTKLLVIILPYFAFRHHFITIVGDWNVQFIETRESIQYCSYLLKRACYSPSFIGTLKTGISSDLSSCTVVLCRMPHGFEFIYIDGISIVNTVGPVTPWSCSNSSVFRHIYNSRSFHFSFLLML